MYINRIKYLNCSVRPFFLAVFLCVFVGCSGKLTEKDLPQLNGYWEIKKVTLADGTVKTYNVNLTIDYIELDRLTGFRKKVKPKFNGSYDTSDDAELFTITKKDEDFQLTYKNDLSHWNETIVQLSKNHFSVVAEDGAQYDYKRYEPINVHE